MELTIGQVAKMAQVNIQTIRYYERQGLISFSHRSSGGYRLYSPIVVESIKYIRRIQQLGFSLQEIRELIDLSSGDVVNAKKVKEMATIKLAEVERKIQDLQGIRKALSELANTCPAVPCPPGECPFIKRSEANGQG